MLLGFDPGRDKCGIAVMSRDRQLYYHQVVESKDAIAAIAELQQQYPIEQIVMGNQTTSKQWQKQLQEYWGDRLPIHLVDERYSTLEARDRYWQMYPPQGLQRLIPQGMRLPPRPIDDLVAILLIERYLHRLSPSQNGN
ncbi:MAG: pre-16S rRNA-processing nuclease YqgF [Jaaginema sp. PMC 1079.18]|nr:pre-16S rRNA-processing nuclease YqgF [Jaaginema sp. PMC 1080.18]MEC4850304.1 pre-16S rRNA-processing nuclease YqgF [Jaaginema sp. PMC 1079.18]MEC4865874.1 pre-16S rRNA-processing nuclease YqgF [Jaaginema sp. PMC 1078.18]